MKADPDAGWECPSGPQGVEGVDGVDGPKPATPKRGRPRVSEQPCSSVSVRVPTELHDRLIRLSGQRRQTVSEYVRDVMIQLFLHRP